MARIKITPRMPCKKRERGQPSSVGVAQQSRRRANYGRKTIHDAIKKVKKDNWTIYKGAKEFCVPYNTLKRFCLLEEFTDLLEEFTDWRATRVVCG